MSLLTRGLNDQSTLPLGFETSLGINSQSIGGTLARVTESLEIGVFGHGYGPKCDPHLLEEDMRQANLAFDALLVA